jgi:hypothetical protein
MIWIVFSWHFAIGPQWANHRPALLDDLNCSFQFIAPVGQLIYPEKQDDRTIIATTYDRILFCLPKMDGFSLNHAIRPLLERVSNSSTYHAYGITI